MALARCHLSAKACLPEVEGYVGCNMPSFTLGDLGHALVSLLHFQLAGPSARPNQGRCAMAAIKLPYLTNSFLITFIAVLLIVGLLFWAVATR